MAIFSDLTKKFTQTSSKDIGQAVEELVGQAIMQRRSHERRWYDNNFFDDGYHFRVVSRKTGRVIDHANKSAGYVERAIPRASRQIRGVTNLLFAAEPYPVVYPERVTAEDFRDPNTRQIDQQKYQQAMEQTKEQARKRGTWLSNEWEEKQDLPIKLIDMMLKSAKNSIAYLQVYTDPKSKEIVTKVLDAFDIICFGDRNELKELPFMTKAAPMDLKDILSSPLFKPEMVAKLTPDNKYATSEIKDAYMRARYGSKLSQKDDGSVIIKETFMQEYLNDSNWEEAVAKDAGGSMEGKSRGDGIMRHTFSAAGVTLNDEYIDYDCYPFAEYRFEPGALYQVPFIERFIPQNKSLDIVVTRLEKWVNAMIVGVYQKRKGESFNISNFPGGQVMEYETTPLAQMQHASVGNTPFEVVKMLDSYIEEQGASTAALNQIPSGVKSGKAIESVKSTEYSNLKISTLMLKRTIKQIAELMLERGHKDFLEPVEVETLEDGKPNYFDVIGKRGAELSQKVGKQLPQDIVTIDKDAKVRIEIEPGLGLTMEGKKEAMETILTEMRELAKEGYIPPAVIQQIVKKFLENFGYGSTQELIETWEQSAGQGDLSDEQIKKVKIAVLQSLKDAGVVGPQLEEMMIKSTQVGTLQTLKDTGLADGLNKQEQPKSLAESLSIAFKDLPEDTKAAVIESLGLPRPISPSPSGTDQLNKHAQTINTIKEGNQPPDQQGGQNGSSKSTNKE